MNQRTLFESFSELMNLERKQGEKKVRFAPFKHLHTLPATFPLIM